MFLLSRTHLIQLSAHGVVHVCFLRKNITVDQELITFQILTFLTIQFFSGRAAITVDGTTCKMLRKS